MALPAKRPERNFDDDMALVTSIGNLDDPKTPKDSKASRLTCEALGFIELDDDTLPVSEDIWSVSLHDIESVIVNGEKMPVKALFDLPNLSTIEGIILKKDAKYTIS